MLEITRVAGGARNVTLHITGLIDADMPMTPLDTGFRERMKLRSVVWALQEKLGMYLWWSKEKLLLPMESRNSLRFDEAATSPVPWDGIMYINSFNFTLAPTHKTKAFFIVLDFDR